ncbi:hypothetical protein KW516_18975 [Vibrio fluvialis]|nr:hypothetical protein [Vibrio fluvialis]
MKEIPTKEAQLWPFMRGQAGSLTGTVFNESALITASSLHIQKLTDGFIRMSAAAALSGRSMMVIRPRWSGKSFFSQILNESTLIRGATFDKIVIDEFCKLRGVMINPLKFKTRTAVSVNEVIYGKAEQKEPRLYLDIFNNLYSVDSPDSFRGKSAERMLMRKEQARRYG